MGKNVAPEVTGSYYAVARKKRFSSFGIYADVNKFILEVNGVVGALYKLCESYSETRLYLRKQFMEEKEDPAPQDIAPTDSPPSLPEGGIVPSLTPRGEKKRSFQVHHVGCRRAHCDRRSVKRERR
jgi:hypothetical protein